MGLFKDDDGKGYLLTEDVSILFPIHTGEPNSLEIIA